MKIGTLQNYSKWSRIVLQMQVEPCGQKHKQQLDKILVRKSKLLKSLTNDGYFTKLLGQRVDEVVTWISTRPLETLLV